MNESSKQRTGRSALQISSALLLTLCLGTSQLGAAASDAATACATALSRSEALVSESESSATLSVLVWNLQKSNQSGWDDDFARLSADRDLLLLQEATLAARLEERWLSIDRHFAPGFQLGQTRTGVMTLSRLPATTRCQLSAMEPLLRTPKAMAVSRYRWASGERLLVINLHAVNFSLGMAAFDQQINDISAVISAHSGPLLLGGDFNTWRQKRLLALQRLADQHGLEAVAFSPDLRSQVFGKPLDHVLVRGLEVLEAKTERVASSDHNPLLLTVRAARMERLPNRQTKPLL